jgi:hypothetical protein
MIGDAGPFLFNGYDFITAELVARVKFASWLCLRPTRMMLAYGRELRCTRYDRVGACGGRAAALSLLIDRKARHGR